MPGKPITIHAKMGKDRAKCVHPSDRNTVDMARRKALAKLGILTIAAYAAPVLMTLSEAHGKDSSGSSGSSGSGPEGQWSGGAVAPVDQAVPVQHPVRLVHPGRPELPA